MAAINTLSQATPTAGASIPFYSPENGADRRASVTDLAALLQSLLSSGTGVITQYAAPSATGFNVAIAPPTDGASMHLLLTPAAGYAAGTITLPAVASCQHGQEVVCNCTQAVTALTVSGNGATVTGAPTTLAANAFFRLRFDGVLKVWYRIG